MTLHLLNIDGNKGRTDGQLQFDFAEKCWFKRVLSLQLLTPAEEVLLFKKLDGLSLCHTVVVTIMTPWCYMCWDVVAQIAESWTNPIKLDRIRQV